MHHVDKEAFFKGNVEHDPEEKVVVFDRSPNYVEVVAKVRIALNWMDLNDIVCLEGRHNVGFGPHSRWKIMPINSELCWSAYKEMVVASQDKALELFATQTFDLNRGAAQGEVGVQNELSNEQEVYEATWSQPPMTQHESSQPPSPMQFDRYELSEEDTDELEDELHNTCIGDVERTCRQEDMDHDIPYSRGYASDSEDDGPDEEVDEDGFTAKESEVFKKIVGRDHRISLFRDLSLADKAVVDGGSCKLLEARPSSKKDTNADNYGIAEGLKFESFLELKTWIKEYAVRYFRPFKVVHSDVRKRYTVKCEDATNGCPWVVRARPWKGGPQWILTKCVSSHMCSGKGDDHKDVDDVHRQLTSEFIGYRLSNSIEAFPTFTVKSIQGTVKEIFGYSVKYGKAWKAKQAAFQMLYGDWEQAYNRLPRLLGAMAATNPGMITVVEPFGQKTREYKGATVRVFGRAFWAFGQCIRAFKHCRPVVSVDGTFLTGQFRGTILIAVAHDANDRLLPLAFALVTAENNDNWEWFMGLLRTMVFEPQREVCIISDRHQGILNAVEIDIPGHAPVHHRWCMRHFVSNFYRTCGNKDLAERLKACSLAYTELRFYRLYNNLVMLNDLSAGGKDFLRRHESQVMKWA